MLTLNNFSVLCICLEELVKREERDILLRPVEAEQKQKQKHQHHQNQLVEEHGEEEGLRWQGRPDVGVALEIKVR